MAIALLNCILIGLVSALNCGVDKIFCRSGVFTPGFEPVYFEGQIALWHSALIIKQEETKSTRLHGTNVGCVSTESKQKIDLMLQVKNIEASDAWDGNTNEETEYNSYTSPVTDSISHSSFYGGFVELDRCMYIVSLGYDSGKHYYNFQRKTINIEYD